MELPFYVCHYRGNIERYEYLKSLKIPFKFITEFDKEELDGYPERLADDLSKKQQREILIKILPTLLFNEKLHEAAFSKQYISPVSEYQKIGMIIKDESYDKNRLDFKRLTLPEISIFQKHMEALRLIASSNHEWGIVIEDDCIFKDDSKDRLRELLNEIPNDVGYVDIGGGASLIASNAFNKLGGFRSNLYHITPPSSRTTCAYAIRKSVAQKIVSMKSMPLIMVDWFIVYAFHLLETKVLWIEEPIFIHGSEHGFYSSGIR